MMQVQQLNRVTRCNAPVVRPLLRPCTCQAEARLLSHFGLLWVAREAASTEKQRAAEAAARRRRPSSSSIGAA